jgi:hypothetical protein
VPQLQQLVNAAARLQAPSSNNIRLRCFRHPTPPCLLRGAASAAGQHGCAPADKCAQPQNNNMSITWQLHHNTAEAPSFCTTFCTACSPARMGCSERGWRACWWARSRCSSACCTQSLSQGHQGSRCRCCLQDSTSSRTND